MHDLSDYNMMLSVHVLLVLQHTIGKRSIKGSAPENKFEMLSLRGQLLYSTGSGSP